MSWSKALLATAALVFLAAEVCAAPPAPANPPDKDQPVDAAKASGKFEPFKSESKTSTGSVAIGGQTIAYQAVAGTLIVHPKGWDDVPRDPKSDKEEASPSPGAEGDGHNPTAEASMFYVAYFKNNAGPSRPVTFLYNGGPGSSTMWLHMGAFGPRRIVTSTRCAHAGGALFARQQRLESARRERSRIHRRAGHRLQPHRRQGQGEGVLRHRSGRLRLRRVHLAVPHQVRPLELAQVPVRRELRHAALRRPHQPARGRAVRRFQRRHPAVANPELRSEPGPADQQPRHRSALRDGRFPPMRPPPGITTSSRAITRICAALLAEVEQFAMGDYARALAAGLGPAARRAHGDRTEAARLHGPAGRVHFEGGSAHRRRGISPDPAGGRGHDDRPARYALLRPRHRSVEPAGELRPAIERLELGVRLGFQRLRAQGAALDAPMRRSSRASASSEPGISVTRSRGRPRPSPPACRRTCCPTWRMP